ncbi:MAG TPA: iron chelate uptake ABC transporter family permease subunit, partial [Chitinophagales bacterium]|nr:iron chelate uptake ABC transporter family permease subunit [Chitinophagales bacterium]HQU39133.1 iron chelate uptake ABC transporter family permease subunit [Chitinophagales bacterium]HRX24443.1 iron chelate uptake ABC transporter family permease subunit [Chitinophagales bacterium]
PNVRFVLAGMVLLGIASSTIGTFAFLRKRSLTGDAVAHSVLPGVCLAFLIFQTRNLWVLLGGAFVTGWLSILFVDLITSKSRIKPDAAIGIALSFFFAIGIVLLTYIQQTGLPGQSGLNNFLLGKAAAMAPEDIRTMSLVSIVIVGTVAVFFQPFRLLSFDPDFAKATGMPVRFYETLLTTLTVLAVAAGIQAVGVVLMAAMLITPPAAARFWTNKLGVMILLSVLFGVAGGILGAYVSFANNKMPTGPWVVTMTSLLVVASILFAPGKGVFSRWWKKRQYRNKVQRENLLKALYHLEEATPGKQWFGLPEIMEKRPDLSDALAGQLRQLQRNGMIEQSQNKYAVTPEGMTEGKRIVRIHRLWEMYLTEKMNIASDHVHEDAEAIEHIITPELEERLAALLDYPEKDPHNKEIPW